MVLPPLGGFSFTGPIAKQISDVDISWIVGLFVSGIVYWLLARSLNVQSEASAIQASDQELASGEVTISPLEEEAFEA